MSSAGCLAARLFDKLRMTRMGSGDLPYTLACPATVLFHTL
jgi:hypothetical protein